MLRKLLTQTFIHKNPEMRKNAFVLTLSLLLLVQATSVAATRQVNNFDFDWKFAMADDPSFATTSFDDSQWQTVQLPHDWNITMNFDINAGGSAAYLPESVGWYRKTFSTPHGIAGKKRVKVHFDGIFQQSDVYVNGKHMGFHPYGFSSIEYDITDQLKPQGLNTIAVRVNCTGGRPRWYGGSGIYRHVTLDVVDNVHVKTYGTYITTPTVSEGQATVSVETMVSDESTTPCSPSVHWSIISPDGKKVAEASGKQQIDGGSEARLRSTMSVKAPKLWNVSSPDLYTLVTEVRHKGKVVDVVRTRFGIRTIEFSPSQGFLLNGHHTKLQGLCLHQDEGVLGVALPRRSMERRLQKLKEYGCNAIRCAHNAPASEFLDLCDSLGFVVIDEAFDKWCSGYYEKYFDEWWQADLSDMLLRDRNHPSIILWSIGNELQEAWAEDDSGVRRATMLRNFVHELEPTRPVNIACQNRHQKKFADVADVVGYNYLEQRMVSEHKTDTTRRCLITEELPYYQGAEGNIRSYDTDNPWNTIMANDYCAGGFIWSGVDYLGEAGWPSKGWPTGLFDICMNEKPRAAFHRAMWNATPIVRINVKHHGLDIDNGRDLWQWPRMAALWNFPTDHEGMVMEVLTPTNCEEVELYVNDNVMGRKHTADFDNHTIEWNVPYQRGSIMAKAYNDGKQVAQYELRATGPTTGLMLTPDRTTINADGYDLSYIDVELRDSIGNLVQTDDRLLTVSFEGEGRLRGIQTGDLRRETSFMTRSIKSYFGRAQVVVQSTRKPGTMKVTLRMEGDDRTWTAEVTTR